MVCFKGLGFEIESSLHAQFTSDARAQTKVYFPLVKNLCNLRTNFPANLYVFSIFDCPRSLKPEKCPRLEPVINL
jgi:hypothetical protein